jgi:hypothetical protein
MSKLDETFNVDAPSCTQLEADTLFYHHLQLAIAYFEILNKDHEFNTMKFNSVTLAPALDFYNKLVEAYKESEEY